MSKEHASNKSPNILLLLVDQLRYPRFSYGDKGLDNSIKDILSFVKNLNEDNEYIKNFPGFVKLREYSTVLTNHTIAESACIPSRSSIMTGQYGPRTGVTQTDGLFKSGDAHNFPWLKADSFATMGDWFKKAGYTTHYFGKWHTSNPPEHTLQGFGFDDWELSWPEPHGSLLNNLGTYRDYQFSDLACSFLRNRGLGIPYARSTSEESENNPNDATTPETKPFFAVFSFTNPHDIAAYPTLPRSLVPGDADDVKNFGPGGSVPVPPKDTMSTVPPGGYISLNLNPTGLKQNNAQASPTQNEDLLKNNKPNCQYDYSIKVAVGLAVKTGLGVAKKLAEKIFEKTGKKPSDEDMLKMAVKASMEVAIPFQTQEDSEGAATGFLQYYAYMISMVDKHILRVLETLEESGLRKDTVLVFASDHGEYGASHSKMIEKWHTAYQEILHVPVLISSPTINHRKNHPQVVNELTSHIDLLPTLLGLANVSEQQQQDIKNQLAMDHSVCDFPGKDLSPLIDKNHPQSDDNDLLSGLKNRSVLFATDDMITEPLPLDEDPHNKESWEQYTVYNAVVEQLKKEEKFSQLDSGPVSQPNHVRSVRSGDWKLVKYCDPWSLKPVNDQWELYNLAIDGNELCNLLIFNAEQFPTVIANENIPEKLNMSRQDIKELAHKLKQKLIKLENENLTPYPSSHPSSGN